MIRLNRTLDPLLTGYDADRLHRELRKKVVGQEEAVEQIVNIYQTYLAGMQSAGRPVGNFLFLGPTGTGKTRLVEATAESLAGDARAVVKVDCAEFQHSHEIAKLIGSPPGYLGHRETHPMLSQDVLNQYHTERFRMSFVLFDEIEKASDALWNLLLGILDKATLTLGDNRRVDFSRTFIFMTANLGGAEMSAMLRPGVGFASGELTHSPESGEVEDKLNERLSRASVEAARRKFTPEFMNRLDKVVVFRALCTEQLRQILEIELAQVQRRVLQSPTGIPFILNISDAARQFLLRTGTDTKYGARHLKRAIERSLVHPISNLMASGQIEGGDLIGVGYEADQDCLAFVKEAAEMPEGRMLELLDSVFGISPLTMSAVPPGMALPEYAVPATARVHRRA
ncbi:MAG: ATPase domain protein [Bryobacterales bacterium]|nr:ATPase domain protein [Bryobacterales bacterium]